ncbi:LuxR C-terminal-related transcriptional regulator [Cupriavidus sp. SK-4]|uniref:helix-turn-helix transcriptional regulator n=1 Tax=Cupriavidus sp. SK-4 TaxID=574750 RepID=UPI000AA76A18|nr:LuxR C-terminal-related transcriptional regulator [Cupriavidus sp. SK-4]
MKVDPISDWQYAETVLNARTPQEVSQVALRAARGMGFNHHAYVMKQPVIGPESDNDFVCFHDFSADWARARYEPLRARRHEDSDARVEHVRAGMPATSWNALGEVDHTRRDIGQRARNLLRSAGEHGLRSGLTIPLWTPGIDWAFMTLTTDATTDLRALRTTLAPMSYFAHCLHSALRRLQGEACRPVLSRRQREILQWAAIGKTTWEISTILAISESTVYFHLNVAASKLNTRGRQATCARAVALGLLSI